MVVARAHLPDLGPLPREEHDELSEMLRVAIRWWARPTARTLHVG